MSTLTWIKYLKSPSGLVKCLVLVLGSIALALSILSLPGAYMTEISHNHNNTFDFWKFYAYVGAIAVALFGSIALVPLANNSSRKFLIVSCFHSTLSVITVVASSALLLHEYMHLYQKRISDRNGCLLPGWSDEEELVEACGSTENHETCVCVVKYIMKLDAVIAATSFGMIMGGTYLIDAVNTFLSPAITRESLILSHLSSIFHF